jgi:site-specific DNA-methyltransferase (adenine-specific)
MDVVQTSLTCENSTFDFTSFVKEDFYKAHKPYQITNLGVLFEGDCLSILPAIKDSSINTIFADPPFNLNKKYGNKSKDKRTESEYLNWCYEWIDECVRILKPGGALFIYNLPKWNIVLGANLIHKGLTFRHDIAIVMNNGFPIAGRLYPSHYSLLYFTKGKPKTFHKIRTPIEKCRHCDGEIKDYGGHRKSMNPNGVSLKDIWTDIPPVRHQKFKSKSRKANSLSTKLLDRVVELTTNPGDVVLDPFGGSGTTYDVCEKKNRHWIGIEIDFAEEIVNRLTSKNIQHHSNNDYVED